MQNGRNLAAFRWGLVFAISYAITDIIESIWGLGSVGPEHAWVFIGLLLPFVLAFLLSRVVDRWYVRNGRVGLYDKNDNSTLTLWKVVSFIMGLMIGLSIIISLSLLILKLTGFNILGSPD
jgi:hypothetical protein